MPNGMNWSPLSNGAICTRSDRRTRLLLRAASPPLGGLAPDQPVATGIIGFVLSVLGSVTPALVALFAAIGISGSVGWLDYVLLPAMAVFAGFAIYGLMCRRRLSNKSL